MRSPAREADPSELAPLRNCVDLNVFVAAFLARERGRRGTAAQEIIAAVRRGHSTLGSLQLVISWGMLNRLRKVLTEDQRVPDQPADLYLQAIAALAALGPEHLDPVLTLGGTGVLPLRDEEDHHVLETAVAGSADLLVTSNLDDFAFRDTVVLEEGRVLEYHGPGGRLLIVHPFRMAAWHREGRISHPEPRPP